MTFAIKQATFEGPLDLLLSLIEQEKLDITEIALAQVTDQYVSFVDQMEQQRLPEVSEFLVVAARLMLLKSRALLPIEVDEEDDIDDLVEQLAEYKVIKELASLLGDEFEHGKSSFGHSAQVVAVEPRFIADGIDIAALSAAYESVLRRIPDPRPEREEQLAEYVTLEECIERVSQTLRVQSQPFATLFEGVSSRLQVIVTFLAVLELFKQRCLKITGSNLTLAWRG
jgi:segregation and condensation protein A